jgi:hypothetical protein
MKWEGENTNLEKKKGEITRQYTYCCYYFCSYMQISKVWAFFFYILFMILELTYTHNYVIYIAILFCVCVCKCIHIYVCI